VLCTACIDHKTEGGPSGCKFLAKKSITVLYHSPYSPDLATADYLLFPKVKSEPKGCCFDTISDIQNNVTSELKSVVTAEFYRDIQKPFGCASRCIELEGMYVEG
jgi:hypothetical protein